MTWTAQKMKERRAWQECCQPAQHKTWGRQHFLAKMKSARFPPFCRVLAFHRPISIRLASFSIRVSGGFHLSRAWTSISNYQLTNSHLFHSSGTSMAKKKSNKKGSDDDNDDDDDNTGKPAAELPKVKAFEASMDNTVKWIMGELGKIKVGAVSVEMFSSIALPGTSYGTVGKAGQVLMKTSTKLVVSVYDPSMASAVAEALKNAGFNLNPSIEGNNVNAAIPRPSKEAREQMVANASKLAEKAKMDVRNMRKRGLDEAKKSKSSVSEDDFRRFNKDLEAATEKRIESIANAMKAKEKELLNATS